MLTLGIILFIIGCCMDSYEDSVYDAQRREEKRHKELMRTLNENRSVRVQAPRRRKVVRRRIVKDKEGNILGEEVIEEEWEE